MDLSNVEIIQHGKYQFVVRRLADDLMKQRIISHHATPNFLERGYCLVGVLRNGETLDYLDRKMKEHEANRLQKTRKQRD